MRRHHRNRDVVAGACMHVGKHAGFWCLFHLIYGRTNGIPRSQWSHMLFPLPVSTHLPSIHPPSLILPLHPSFPLPQPPLHHRQPPQRLPYPPLLLLPQPQIRPPRPHPPALHPSPLPSPQPRRKLNPRHAPGPNHLLRQRRLPVQRQRLVPLPLLPKPINLHHDPRKNIRKRRDAPRAANSQRAHEEIRLSTKHGKLVRRKFRREARDLGDGAAGEFDADDAGGVLSGEGGDEGGGEVDSVCDAG